KLRLATSRRPSRSGSSLLPRLRSEPRPELRFLPNISDVDGRMPGGMPDRSIGPHRLEMITLTRDAQRTKYRLPQLSSRSCFFTDSTRSAHRALRPRGPNLMETHSHGD